MKKLFMILASIALLCACNDDTAASEEVGPETRISINSDALEFLSSGDIATGENTVTVTSSGDWRLTGKKTWCTPSAVEGKSGDAVIFTAGENPTSEPRSITYTFFCGDKTAKLTVTQSHSFIVDISQDEFSVPATGEADIRVRLESNVALSAEIDAAGTGWIELPATRSTEISYLHLKVTANDTYGPRTGKIVLRGGNIEPRTITVNQVQNNELKLDQDLYKQPLEESTLRMIVWSNIPYEVLIPDDVQSWVVLEAQPSDPMVWSSQELVFSLKGADFYRTTSVTLVSKDGKISIPVGIQQGEAVTFEVPDPLFRKYLLDNKYIEQVGDKCLITPAGAAVTTMDLSGFYAQGGIKSLVGIEYFTKLVKFNCSFNSIRELDLSKNPLITDMTPSKTNAYERLTVGEGVTTIHFGATSAWGIGYMYDYNSAPRYWAQSFVVNGANVEVINVTNNQLKSIDVSGCPKLQMLKCVQDGGVMKTIYMSESQRGNVDVTKDPGAQIVYR